METILSTCTGTHTYTHEHTEYTNRNLYTKRPANRLQTDEDNTLHTPPSPNTCVCVCVCVGGGGGAAILTERRKGHRQSDDRMNTGTVLKATLRGGGWRRGWEGWDERGDKEKRKDDSDHHKT